MIFFDTESVGLVGPTVLIQYAYNDGSVKLHEVAKESTKSTLNLIEELCYHREGICGFNLTHDWFHINKLYNLLYDLDRTSPPDPLELAKIQQHLIDQDNPGGRWCLRPQKALDLYLYAQTGPYQTLMYRKPITIKRVPTNVALDLAKFLKDYIQLDDIYFSRRKEGYAWSVETDPDDRQFADIVLQFAPSSSLKRLVENIFKVKTIDYPIPDRYMPPEHAYNPYDIGWLPKIQYHIDYWHTNKTARSYAEQDVIWLQRLYKHWDIDTKEDDVDSELACCVGAVRWSGYAIDIPKIEEELNKCKQRVESCPVNCNSSIDVRRYIQQYCDKLQKLAVSDTKHTTLESITNWNKEDGNKHEAANAAQIIIDARRAYKRITILERLLQVKRFCPNYRIIGTKSGRMSGGSDFGKKSKSINPQGIQRETEFRKLFTLYDEGYRLSGGDFAGFEPTIAAAVYNDDKFTSDLKSGKKAHALFAVKLFSEDYDKIIESAGTENDLYWKGKTGFLGVIYGQQPEGLGKRLNVGEKESASAYKEFITDYPGIGNARKQVQDAFCSMRQPRGIGTSVEWHEPAEFIESLYGFRRYYTLENRICKQLFELASNFQKIFGNTPQGTVIRRKHKGKQTLTGATQSALYATAFQIQASNMRTAANHVIQATGARITKLLQYVVWDFQPRGVHYWKAKPMNQHDEVLVVHKPEITHRMNTAIVWKMEEFKQVVPLISLDWKTNVSNWGELK